MKIKLSKENFNEKLKTLSNEYKILAPVSLEYMGTFSDTDVVRYKEVSSLDEMELNRKSNFSAKEIVFPITQILFYFTENEFKESDIDDKKLLIFLRAC
ncbi:anaerobic sulfite reductase subunit A, partial [Romboutsia sp. 1001216sp1]|nr:anaerobic sulfite reductase subunit A [Romboutsia sp. 1001216sp1]